MERAVLTPHFQGEMDSRWDFALRLTELSPALWDGVGWGVAGVREGGDTCTSAGSG